jgi:hypothetical protein
MILTILYGSTPLQSSNRHEALQPQSLYFVAFKSVKSWDNESKAQLVCIAHRQRGLQAGWKACTSMQTRLQLNMRYHCCPTCSRSFLDLPLLFFELFFSAAAAAGGGGGGGRGVVGGATASGS